jgi:putative endonuclease
MYWVYILKNHEGIYYKGYTTDLDKRLIEHNSDLSRYTSNKGPWLIVYSKIFENKKEALIEEKRIKRLNVKSIENLISVG